MSRMIEGMHRPTWLPGTGLMVVFTCILAGCQEGSADAPQRLKLSGSITWEGESVPSGDMTFAPDTESGNSGPAGVAVITNGRYETVEGKGPVAGPQIVTLSGYAGGEGSDPASGPPVLFSDYRMKVDLKPEQTTFDFALPENDE